MKVEKIYCDRCGREIIKLNSDQLFTLHKDLVLQDLCGPCEVQLYNWFYDKNKSEVLEDEKSIKNNVW